MKEWLLILIKKIFGKKQETSHPKNITQTHSGTGDNVAGDKVIGAKIGS